MNIVLFYHSLVSDWNHGNAHFLRGIATELIARGHSLRVYEPENGWSRHHLLSDHGPAALHSFHRHFPHLHSISYDEETLDLDAALEDADLAIVHEWNSPALIRRLGRHRAANPHYRLLFHDTHHRAVSETLTACDLSDYDGVLAFGEALRQLYRGAPHRVSAWTWHEAADTRTFHPRRHQPLEGDLVWIGNWGDGERERELREFLIEPVKRLKLRATVFGVRYPEHALNALAEAGIAYGGYLPNHDVPSILARYRLTIHVPRRYYTTHLPGIPTIRPFEALACGMPLICAPWDDREALFSPGRDFLLAHDADQMRRHMQTLLARPRQARLLAAQGLLTIQQRHTCAHRAEQLLRICRCLDLDTRPRRWTTPPQLAIKRTAP